MIVAYKFGIQKGGALSPAEGIKVHFFMRRPMRERYF